MCTEKLKKMCFFLNFVIVIVLIQKKLEDLNLFNTIFPKNFKVIGLKYKFLKGGGLLMVLTVLL